MYRNLYTQKCRLFYAFYTLWNVKVINVAIGSCWCGSVGVCTAQRSPLATPRVRRAEFGAAFTIRHRPWDRGSSKLGKSVMKGSTSRQFSALVNTAPQAAYIDNRSGGGLQSRVRPAVALPRVASQPSPLSHVCDLWNAPSRTCCQPHLLTHGGTVKLR